jgi:hypothetical protein
MSRPPVGTRGSISPMALCGSLYVLTCMLSINFVDRWVLQVESTEYCIHRSLLEIHAPDWLRDVEGKSEPIFLENVKTPEIDAILSVMYPTYVRNFTRLQASVSPPLAVMSAAAASPLQRTEHLSYALQLAGASLHSAPLP